ncbi:MAG: hypothetical protein JSV71_01520 [Nitrospiraceae bacterium]|nr:MAG: hypothetical protein JSV71_01520 [Nitrospiraceae bacterium]
MKKISLIFITILVLFSTSASARDGKSLFEKNCIYCHSLERVLIRKKTREGWRRTVMRMASYTFGRMSSDNIEMIAQYLASTSGLSGSLSDREKEMALITNREDSEVLDFKKVKLNQFLDPKFCEGCHAEIYEMWNGSMHSKAFLNPLWQSATKLFVSEISTPGEILEMRTCVKCHTPLGFRSYQISHPEDDFDRVPELPAQGVFCNWCHNISEVKHIGDARYEIDPGGGEENPSTMLGPYKDAYSNVHPTKYSELHTRSEFCGLCHNVSHAINRLPIEMTYDEWKNSPYNTGDPETTVSCQDCHMRQRPGIPSTGKTARLDNPGKSSKYGPRRKHVWTHYFVGANAIITKQFRSITHAEMAVQNLKHAADLEIIKNATYRRKETASIYIKVTNSGAGHYLPTGLTAIRQMWLHVKVSDSAGKVLLQSGELDEQGGLEKNTVVYHTVLGNNKGEPTINIAKAAQILHDHRIPPKGHITENFTFNIPSDAESPLLIEAILKYRSISKPLAQELMADKTQDVPVIIMVSDFKSIDFQ